MNNEKELVDEAMNIIADMDINEVYTVSGALATFVLSVGVTFDLPSGMDPIQFGDSLARVAILTLDRHRGKYADLAEKAKQFINENGRSADPFRFVD